MRPKTGRQRCLRRQRPGGQRLSGPYARAEWGIPSV